MAANSTQPPHERIVAEREAGRLPTPGEPVTPGLEYAAMLKVWELPILGVYGYNADEHCYWDEATQKLYTRPYSREHDDDPVVQDQHSRCFDNEKDYARHVRSSHLGPSPLHLMDARQRAEFERSAASQAVPDWMREWMREQVRAHEHAGRMPWERSS